MRITLTAILLLGFSVYSAGQTCTVTSDTFSYGQRFFRSQLILRSDATFNLRNRSCTNSLLMMGFWEKQKDSIVLNYTEKIAINISSRSFSAGESDTLVRFFVRDSKGNVLKDYELSFCRNDQHDDNLLTDSNGMVAIQRKFYTSFYTETDVDNLTADNNWDNWGAMKRPLSSSIKEVFIILSPLTAPLQDNIVAEKRSFYIKQADILVARMGEYKKRRQH